MLENSEDLPHSIGASLASFGGKIGESRIEWLSVRPNPSLSQQMPTVNGGGFGFRFPFPGYKLSHTSREHALRSQESTLRDMGVRKHQPDHEMSSTVSISSYARDIKTIPIII